MRDGGKTNSSIEGGMEEWRKRIDSARKESEKIVGRV